MKLLRKDTGVNGKQCHRKIQFRICGDGEGDLGFRPEPAIAASAPRQPDDSNRPVVVVLDFDRKACFAGRRLIDQGRDNN